MTITMATIEQFTPLEIIDYVTPLMLAQNAKSEVIRMGFSDDNLTCAYRGNNEMKCPVGMLMTDEEYADLEDNDGNFKSAYGVCTHFGVSDSEISVLLSQLQSIHDSKEPSEWADELATLRDKYE
jgi:hypothetical protein